jgi:hypothetical protein
MDGQGLKGIAFAFGYDIGLKDGPENVILGAGVIDLQSSDDSVDIDGAIIGIAIEGEAERTRRQK